MPSRRKRRFGGRRRQRRCENCAPKAEVIGIIPFPDDIPAGANSGQLFLAQQTSAFRRFSKRFVNGGMTIGFHATRGTKAKPTALSNAQPRGRSLDPFGACSES